MGQAASLLGVSDDTVRRWAEGGRLRTVRRPDGRLAVDGAELARFVAERPEAVSAGPIVGRSARNRLPGLVTRVVRDTVMAQVEIRAGPFRVVSLMSREAADEMDLQPGAAVVASVKATQVVVELPEP
jgi:molybdopterin-binding protein